MDEPRDLAVVQVQGIGSAVASLFGVGESNLQVKVTQIVGDA